MASWSLLDTSRAARWALGPGRRGPNLRASRAALPPALRVTWRSGSWPGTRLARGLAAVTGRFGRRCVSSSGPKETPRPPLQVLDEFAFGLFDLDWDVFSQHIEGAVNRVPVLERTGIKSTVCGPGEALSPGWAS